MFMYICMGFFSFSLVYIFASVYLFVPVNQKFFDVFIFWFLDQPNHVETNLLQPAPPLNPDFNREYDD